MIVVVDLDGTLCNSGHREHLARAKQWDEFHGKLGEDEPHPDVVRFLREMWSEHDVVALTGRNDKYRSQTLSWLHKHDLAQFFDDVLMRPDNDWRPDHELKPALLDAWLDENGRTHADVWLILEDRDKVVEAWRNLGHNCWQTRPGGY